MKELILKDINIADNFFKRLKGLMFKKDIKYEDSIIFLNCQRVHSFFMKEPITVVYLNGNFEILTYELLHPWNKGLKVKNARHVLELPSSYYKNIKMYNKVKILGMEG